MQVCAPTFERDQRKSLTADGFDLDSSDDPRIVRMGKSVKSNSYCGLITAQYTSNDIRVSIIRLVNSDIHFLQHAY